MQEPQKVWVWSLDKEDPLEEGMAMHPSIHVWRIPWTKEPGRLQSIGSQRVGHDWSDLAQTLIPEQTLSSKEQDHIHSICFICWCILDQ